MEQGRAVPAETTPTPFLYGSDDVIKKTFHSNAGMDVNRDFELTIKGNGQVTLDGNINNLKPLHAEWQVAPENFTRMVKAFENSQFYTLKEKSVGNLGTHFVTVKIFISVNGKIKQVEHSTSTNSPESQILWELQKIINQETQAEPYIRKFCHYLENYPSESIP